MARCSAATVITCVLLSLICETRAQLWRSHYDATGLPPTYEPGGNERVRLAQWHMYYKQWPYAWPNETEGSRQYALRREEEIMRYSPRSSERWEYWLDFVQTRLHPNFTANGFAVRQIPEEVFGSLKSHFHQNYPARTRVEDAVPYFIEGDRKMVNIPGRLSAAVVKAVQPMHEEWAGGSPLKYSAFYGIRAYENGSTLAMHVDRANTHVISAVMHIARDFGSEEGSWPIEVVDLEGRVVEVELLPGQMLLYESSKCYHGRPKPFRGKYYASAFVHFKPKEGWFFDNAHRVGAIPPHFQWEYDEWKKLVMPRIADSLSQTSRQDL